MEKLGIILEKIADMFRAALRFLENLFMGKGDDALGDIEKTDPEVLLG